MKHKVVVLMLVVILAVINFSIYNKEQHISQGESIYLQLAPVDPRSLMQGDYMSLRYVVADALHEALPKSKKTDSWRQSIDAHNGQIIVSLDTNHVASYQAIYQAQTLKENERLLNYRVRNNQVKLASNAFFFEEGTAQDYQIARYGEFKVNTQGDLLLNAMFDKDLKLITPEKRTQ